MEKEGLARYIKRSWTCSEIQMDDKGIGNAEALGVQVKEINEIKGN